MQEVRSPAKLAAEARKLGFTVTEKVGKTGVVAVMKNGPGPVLLLRADMDGLPVVEQTGLPFASKVARRRPLGRRDGRHARLRPRHPHDRLARHGAAAGGDEGPMVGHIGDDPAAGRGNRRGRQGDARRRPLHALPQARSTCSPSTTPRRFPPGVIGITPGYALANVDSVDITVKGVGGHGAYPQTTRDPIVLASRIVTTLQTLVSRENDPANPAVVTVGSFQAGAKHNIISDEAKLQLTVRSYTPEVRKLLLDGIKRIARGEAIAAGMPEDRCRSSPSARPNIRAVDLQHRETVQQPRARHCSPQNFGAQRVLKTPAVMGGEDFSRFWLADKSIESLIFWVGGTPLDEYQAAGGDAAKLPSLHSPFWAPDAEAVIATATEALTCRLDVLRRADEQAQQRWSGGRVVAALLALRQGNGKRANCRTASAGRCRGRWVMLSHRANELAS